MSKNRVKRKEPDLVAAGFHRLDQKLEDRPPRIKWGPIYRSKSAAEKIAYLEKLAAAMNHAAHLIQNERNQWAELAASKEQDILNVKRALNENNAMIQAEFTKMNEERQQYFAEIKRLRDRIRALEKG
jgi:sugar phosphate isomerase/epimerase